MKKMKIILGVGLLSLLLSGCTTGGNQNSGGDPSGGGSYNPPVHEHTWGTPTYVWADDFSSCTAERVCTEDVAHKETETKASVHTIATAGCESEGQELYTVTFDNSAFETQTHSVRLSPTGHNWGTPTYEWSSNYSQCTATRVCQNDNTHVETETVNSTYFGEVKCVEEVIRTYTATFNNSAFTTQTHNETLSPIGHDWNEPTYEWSTDYSQCTATRVCQNDNTHVETETVNSVYKEITPATIEQEGKGRYVAYFNNSNFSDQQYDFVLDKLPRYGERPVLSGDGKTITYGLYPKTYLGSVDSSSPWYIGKLNKLTSVEENGWYLYNGDYYAKVTATPHSNNYYQFDGKGIKIITGTTYWFKCEPIEWKILNKSGNVYYVVSSQLLDTYYYYNDSYEIRTIEGKTVYSNNYMYSDLRTWLNDDFYNSAFALDDNYIQTTIVDNSASTTNISNNSYACNNTEDKVFLPSYKDYINIGYGFTQSTGNTSTRTCKTTDWSRTRGVYADNSTHYKNCGVYWTRSPSNSREVPTVTTIDDGGGIFFTHSAGYTACGIRPAIRIILD